MTTLHRRTIIKLFLPIIVILITCFIYLGVTMFKGNDSSEDMFVLTKATLIEFTYTNNTLQYNLTLNIRGPFHNYHDNVEALAMYQNVSFGFTTLPIPSIDMLSLTFNGQKMMSFDADQISDLNKEKSIGIYHITTKLCLKTNTTSSMTNQNPKPVVYCGLLLPLNSNNGTLPVAGLRISPCNFSYAVDDCSLHH
ncbi:hypothetical protein VNO77_09199 [Canavalia gladiata]|uniref:Transmembrane protein n=1 Tax=Canavalia gladiata TaxID=3824 RepID=A0AAN9MEJ3_CANGL